ncbi:MAG: hypothetical protein ACR2L3_00050 [Actinomycetota bacterium]
MLDRAFSAVFRNFSTLFLVAFLVAAPLHIGHAVMFEQVISLSELHPEIEGFPDERQVKSVGRAQLDAYRTASLAVLLLEVLLLPLMAGAARRAIRDDEEGKVPTATRAWRGALGELSGLFSGAARRPGVLLGGAAAAVVIGLLARRTGLVLTGFIPDDSDFIGVGLTNSLAHALALPLFFGVWAAATFDAPLDQKD